MGAVVKNGEYGFGDRSCTERIQLDVMERVLARRLVTLRMANMIGRWIPVVSLEANHRWNQTALSAKKSGSTKSMLPKAIAFPFGPL